MAMTFRPLAWRHSNSISLLIRLTIGWFPEGVGMVWLGRSVGQSSFIK